MRRFLFGLVMLGFGCWPFEAYADGVKTALLQALDKVTARISQLEAPLGKTIHFGSLTILVQACHKAPPEETPESAAFVEIQEKRENERPKRLYTGWMFASTPGLAALEHPVYDIWILDCAVGILADDENLPWKPEG